MSDWWCQYCNSVVQPEHVTYEETHDPRTGGCGGVLHGGDSAPTGELVGRIAEQDARIAEQDARLALLEAFLLKLKRSGGWHRSALEFDTRHFVGEELEAELHTLLQGQGE
jgi:hypothetical protein